MDEISEIVIIIIPTSDRTIKSLVHDLAQFRTLNSGVSMNVNKYKRVVVNVYKSKYLANELTS